MKISTKITLSVTLATALLVFALVFYITNQAKEIQLKTAQDNLRNTAQKYAAIIDAELEVPMDNARVLAHLFGKKMKSLKIHDVL